MIKTLRNISLLLILISVVVIGTRAQTAAAQSTAPFRIYLTFEDGPTDEYTPQILDILSEYNAKATFFPNGWQIAGREAILQRIIREGHAIGNHLWEEPDHYFGSDPERIREAYFRTEEAVRAALGPELPRYEAQTKIFRYPGGGGSPFPPTDGVHVITYNWHVDSDDCGWWLDSSDNYDQDVIDNILNTPVSVGGPRWNVYQYGDGAVIAFHDINRVTGRVLPVVLAELQAAGATFEALPRPFDEVGTMPVVIGVPPLDGPGIAGLILPANTLHASNVRTAPALDAPLMMDSLTPQTAVQVSGRSGEWLEIRVGDQVGWTIASNLKVFGPIPSLPQIAQ